MSLLCGLVETCRPSAFSVDVAVASGVPTAIDGTVRGLAPFDTTSGTFEPLGSCDGTPGASPSTTPVAFSSSNW